MDFHKMAQAVQPIVDLIKSWDTPYQCGFLLGSLFILFLMMHASLRWTVFLFRGYPPKREYEQCCGNDENLKGTCLKPGGCRTQEECDSLIENISRKDNVRS